jgi:hypothetical protein
MKIHRKTFLRVIILFAVFTCFGITVYSNSQIRPYILETSAGTNNAENRFNSEINTFDDDQIHHSNEVFSIADFSSPIQIAQDYSLILKFSCSIWQPPKIS